MDKEFIIAVCEFGKDVDKLSIATDGFYNVSIDLGTITNKGNVWIYKNDGRCRGGYKVFENINLWKVEDIEKAKEIIDEIILKEGNK